MKLYEKYRPRTLADMVAQDAVCKRVQAMMDRAAIGGNAFLITGPSGAGKTSLAYIMARHLAEDWNISEFDAVDCTPARIGDIEESWRYAGMGDRAGRVYIVNEVHTMTAQAVGKWLTVLERIPQHAAVIFTTTVDGVEAFGESKRDAKPFLSRCVWLALAQRGLADAFAEHAQKIAQAEGLDGKPIERYKRLVQDKANNLRAVFQFIESGGMAE